MANWCRFRIDPAGLELDLVDGVPVDAVLEPGRGRVLQISEDLEIGVWYGPDATMEQWSRGIVQHWPDAVLEPEREMTIVDAVAARSRCARLPSERVEGGFETPGGVIELRERAIRARETIAVAFVYGDRPVLVSVSVAGTARVMADHLTRSLRPAR
jgi:hypothetical protein